MKFWKLQGAGNDFVIIDNRDNSINIENYSDIAIKLCDRKFGVGADGLLIVKDVYDKDLNADIEMVYYNSDGSRGAMCGNGIRCFSKYVYEKNIIRKKDFNVLTLDGIKKVSVLLSQDNIVDKVKVDMGQPSFNPDDIGIHPIYGRGNRFIEEDIKVGEDIFRVSSILVGVPHTIIFMDEINEEIVFKYGPMIEKHEAFKNRTNVNFVEVIDKETIKVYTWERGCGYTLACGTGVTASAIISNYLDKTSKSVDAHCPGGVLTISLNSDVFMTGQARKVFEGEFEY